MNTRRANSLKLDLKLNLSPPRSNAEMEGANTVHSIMDYTSPGTREISCLSCARGDPHDATIIRSRLDHQSSKAVTSMVLVGCPRCLMYVMLSEVSPKCPRCKSTVLLGFVSTELQVGSNKS